MLFVLTGCAEIEEAVDPCKNELKECNYGMWRGMVIRSV